MKSTLLACSIAVLLSSTAIVHSADMVAGTNAASTPVDAAPVSAFSWTGMYGGLQGGYNWSDLRSRDLDFNVNRAYDLNGGILGGFVGYNWQFNNNIVAGLEADVAHTWNEKNTNLYVPSRTSIETSGSVRGRVGYAFDRVMIYGTAGLAKARSENYTTFINPGTESTVYTGWTAGVGVDFAATDHIFVRGEYRHTNYGRETVFYNDPLFSTTLKQNTIQIGVGYKF